MRTASVHRLIRQLAGLYGVQIAYHDVNRRRHQASPETLLAILRSLGAPVDSYSDVPLAIRQWHAAHWQRMIEPVAVAWDGGPIILTVRLPVRDAGTILQGHLLMEDGTTSEWKWLAGDLQTRDWVEIEGRWYVVKDLPLPVELPLGYHAFTLKTGRQSDRAPIIAAPMRAWAPPGIKDMRKWGVFLPLYALRSRDSWGAGDYSDMESLMDWVSSLGGDFVATLPLLPMFLDEPCRPSPYSPVSRLLWSEFYNDVARAPELEGCPEAKALIASARFQHELARLRESRVVDYGRQMALKREALELLARHIENGPPDRLRALENFAGDRPDVDTYARFRAAAEKQGTPWHAWPESLRNGNLREGDYDEESRRYHIYAQRLADEQIGRLSKLARRNGTGLYLDFPLGVDPEGYDAWRYQNVFIPGAAAGAPPDAVFTQGQNWGTPPLHPHRLREEGYRYFIACLRHHLRHAGILRIDHVMGLHRLYVIPPGLPSSEGMYLRYPAEELYAILSLESHRAQCLIVGEDLGTVPSYVRPSMRRHGLLGMYVLQYELDTRPTGGVGQISPDRVAGINTHDMPPFRQYWQGADIPVRQQKGLLSKAQARKELANRQTLTRGLVRFLRRNGYCKKASEADALRGSLAFLSASRSPAVFANLEDLWLESEPQNIPGTGEGPPNWRRKARHAFEAFREMPEVRDTLSMMNDIRTRGRRSSKDRRR